MLPIVVVAGGPSVTLSAVRSLAMARVKNLCRVIAVNDAIYPCWFADHLHAADRRWWEANHGVPLFFGAKTSMEEVMYPDVQLLRNTGITGYDPTPGCLRTGSNSGYQAVHLAAQFGADEIIILGIDFTDNGSRDHWFGRHAPGLDMNSNIVEWKEAFRGLTDALEARGVRIYNAGNQSTIDWLPRTDIGDFFS